MWLPTQVLAAVEVDPLRVPGREEAEQPAGAALAGHPHVHADLADGGADLRVERRDARVLPHLDPLRPDPPGSVAEPLQVRVAQPRPVADLQVRGPPEPDRGAVRRGDLLEEGRGGVLLEHDQAVRQVGVVTARQRGPRHQRTVHGHAGGDVEEGPAGPGGQRAAPERHLRRQRVAAPKVRAHQVAVLADRRRQVAEDHPAGGKLRVEVVGGHGRGEQQPPVARQVLERGALPFLLVRRRPRVAVDAGRPAGAQLAQPARLVRGRCLEQGARGLDRHRPSRPRLPSGAGSGGSSRPRTPWGAP